MTGRLHRVSSTVFRFELPIVFGVFVGLSQYGLIAPLPWWGFAILLVGAGLLTDLTTNLFPPTRSTVDLWSNIGCATALISVVMYATGWGPMLAVGYAFVLGENVLAIGSRACRPALYSALSCMVLGQVAIGVGLAPSLVPSPEVHGLAVLVALGVVIFMRVVYNSSVAREAAERELRQSEERFKALVANATDIILVFQPDGTIDYCSPAFERVLSYEAGAGMQIGRDLLHPEDLGRVERFFEDLRDVPGCVRWVETRIRDADGHYHWFEVGVTNLLDAAGVGAMVGNLHDVTERRLFEDQLRCEAYRDALTQLPNRAAFLELLEDSLARAADRQGKLGLLFLDIDRFKLVNDSLGHEVGDRLLVEVAQRVHESVRPTDVVCRLGGDEFIVLLEEVRSPQDAIRVADRIVEALREPIVIAARELHVTSSVGIAISQEDYSPGDVLREADLAMYLAKEKGRARWELFDARSAAKVVERLELEGELWRAIDNGELEVHFQPEVSLDGGEIVAFEALVRWQHSQRGLVYPSSFVPLAEESSLIIAIDGFVLREACRRAREWQQVRARGPRLRVSVNLSPRFIRQLGIVDEIVSLIGETGVDPRCIQLEITERMALTQEVLTIKTLSTLRALGLRVAIDDFGTGYSSLAYLRRFPVDVLKLDRSFVEAMDTVEADATIVQAVVTMGHALGMRITAEGVERAEQAAQLRALGCDAAQGFYYSPAVRPAEAEELLRNEYGAGVETARVVPIRRRVEDAS